MNYLVLHIDVEFIVGAVCADNGTSYPVTNGNDDLLWLYFFNNPHQNRISFGKENKAHFNNNEINYYGRFFETIEDEHKKFTVRGIEKPTIELLEYSDLLKTLKDKYNSVLHNTPNNIPTLITFSLSVSDNAKQKTVDYLRNHGFQIESYTIPLSELVCYYPFNKKDFIPANGNNVLLLAATNTVLYLIKLVFSDNYFLIDGEVKSYKGKGTDPRKRALVRYVVNEVNNATGALSSEKEKEDECDKMEAKAEDWLKRIDAQLQNRPFRIIESFSKMPNAKKDVFVRKDNIESDTGHYIQELMDIFDAFKSNNVSGDIAAIFLLGDCFQNSLVKERFNRLIRNEKLFLYANKDIQNILSDYPKIDFIRYLDEEARIHAAAVAQQQQNAIQQAAAAAAAQQAALSAQQTAAATQAEENRKEAKKLFERAVELDKEGKLQDALTNVENAIDKDNDTTEYKKFLSDLVEKIEKRNAKNELYKSYLKKADSLLENNKLEKALEEYEAAQTVFDNADIIQKIIEVKRLIKNREQQKVKIAQLVSEVKELINNKALNKAKEKLDEVLSIDKTNAEAKSLLANIEQTLKQQEKQFNDFVKTADKYFNAANFEDAKTAYEKALKLKPNNEYCSKQIIAIPERKKQIEKEKQQKELESAFNELILDATTAEKKRKLKEALEYLDKALKIKPNDATLKARIKKIKFDLEFETDGISTPKPPVKSNDKGDFTGGGNKSKENTRPKDDDFLGGKTIKSTSRTDDDFIVKKPKKTIEDDDDFLRPKKKN
jgi:tetratricopeptide (TPR) repeat protein